MWVAIGLGVALGLSLAAPPGPMNALIARESSRHGAGAGVRVGIGAPVADLVFLAALVFGLSRVLQGEGVLRSAAAAGSALMFFFAYTTLWPAPPRVDSQQTALPPATFWAGFATAMTNPYQLAWWLSGGYVFLTAQGVWGIVGLTVGIFGWVVVFAWLVAHGARRWTWFEPAVTWVSSFVLFAFSTLLVLVAIGAWTV